MTVIIWFKLNFIQSPVTLILQLIGKCYWVFEYRILRWMPSTRRTLSSESILCLYHHQMTGFDERINKAALWGGWAYCWKVAEMKCAGNTFVMFEQHKTRFSLYDPRRNWVILNKMKIWRGKTKQNKTRGLYRETSKSKYLILYSVFVIQQESIPQPSLHRSASLCLCLPSAHLSLDWIHNHCT